MYKQIFKVRPTLLELDGRTKIFRVGPILPEKMVRGTNFSSGNFGPRTIFSRTKIPVTDPYIIYDRPYSVKARAAAGGKI